MKRTRRGDRPSLEALAERFDDWAAAHIARMLTAAGRTVLPGESVALRSRDGAHDVIVGGDVIGQLPVLDFAVAYGDLAVRYLSEIEGKVQLRRGRPPGLTTIPDDSPLSDALAAMDREGRRVTRESLAARAGFTVDELRGYLSSTNRTMAELKDDLRKARDLVRQ